MKKSDMVIYNKKSFVDTSNWVFWLVIAAIAIFFVWLFFGRGNYDFEPIDGINHKIGERLPDVLDDSSMNSDMLDITSTKSEVIDNLSAHSEINNTPDLPCQFKDDLVEPRNISRHCVEEGNMDKSVSFVDFSQSTEMDFPCPAEYNNTRVSKGEKKCREVLEEIYGRPFKTVRPDFLKNPETGRNLELDCYNHELKIAVEYNGIQHYVWPNFTGQSRDAFIKQLRRDKFKAKRCDEKGVYLIIVPYNVPNELIKDYITYYLPENVSKRLNEQK